MKPVMNINMNLQEQISRIHSMMGVISEDMSIAARRRVKFGDIEKNLKDIKVKSFKKDQPIEDSVRAAILSLLYSVMPEGFEEDDVEYYKVWDEIKKYINNKYYQILVTKVMIGDITFQLSNKYRRGETE